MSRVTLNVGMLLMNGRGIIMLKIITIYDYLKVS